MAITSVMEMSCDKVPLKCSGSVPNSKDSCRLLKFDCPTQSSVSSDNSKYSKTKKNNKSPYLPGDRVQMFSRLTEKRFIYNTNIVSSFPLAMDLYKTNSDDLKPPKKATKKVKKSVLTLPNAQTPVPHACTVSDMNDSEYFDKTEDQGRKVVKKRSKIPNKKKTRVREKDYDFYDRDAQYCSQLNLDLDCSSSTDIMIKNFNGDGRRVSNKKKVLPSSNKIQTASNNLNDVWAVLRNVNRYQFRPSPPMSDESVVPVKKKVPKRVNRKKSRVIGTCRTQEFAYISSYELDKKSPVDSPSSSTDRITVIDNQDDFSKTCDEFEKRLLLTHDFLAKNIIQKNVNQCKSPRNNIRALGKSGTKDNKQLTPTKKKKKNNLNSRVVQNSKSVATNISSGNKDSLVGIPLQPNDNSDILPYKTGEEYLSPRKDSFISSDTRSSKAELPNRMNEQVNKNDNALLNKDHDSTATITTIKPNELNNQPRKLRLVTTMPSSCVIPKLTQTEIKRRLSTMKFPIVILGKDQVSSSFKVKDFEPPQFNGLDDHIWPFMMDWSTTSTVPEDTNHNTQSKNCQPCLLDSNSASDIKNKSRKLNSDFGTYKQKATTWKDKKQANNDFTAKKAKIKSTPESEITDKSLECFKKQKSIVQLKDKMLNFLYKKASNLHDNNESYETDEIKPIIICDENSGKAENKIPVVTDSVLKPDKVLVQNNLPEKKPFLAEGRNKKTPICKYSWAKAKWASDFIENVMKKVRSGVYYTQDRMDFCHTYQTDLKEVSVQAGSQRDSTDSTQTSNSETGLMYDETNNTRRNDIIRIPGFDNTLPMLEIKTLNMKQIAVKHCVTNSVLQFDVSVPVKGDHQNIRSLNKTLPLTPIEITESQTVVYKCKTTILNAMLPAELCSILPYMISSIIDSNSANITSSMENSAIGPIKTSPWLTTIAELTRYENGDVEGIIALKSSPEIKKILEGRFSNIEYIKPILNNIDFEMKYDQCLITELLQTVPVDSLNTLLKCQKSPLMMELDHSQYIQSDASLHQTNEQHDLTSIQNDAPICTALDIYTNKSEQLTSAIKPNNFMDLIERMMRSYNLQINQNLSTYLDMLKFQYDGKNVEIDLTLRNEIGVQKKYSVSVSNLNIDSLYKGFPKIRNNEEHEMNRNSTSLQCINCVNISLTRKSQVKECTQAALNKAKRKGFSKLYRKCNSKPCVSPGEKCTSSAYISLYEITTIDDFFQMLGSKKIFSNVLDGNAVKKILSSVVEMKNWISEINPTQALLILLLVNKKDTQNLVRFRPIILQGIAVNRITKASELDMEIEVIERENFNKLSQCEGLTNLPETITDYENLLDELYWIAKTTASDYNKPFNESSERLLKSLLQKRKKLNPSYLRVMARYVGLGLVKTPTEC